MTYHQHFCISRKTYVGTSSVRTSDYNHFRGETQMSIRQGRWMCQQGQGGGRYISKVMVWRESKADRTLSDSCRRQEKHARFDLQYFSTVVFPFYDCVGGWIRWMPADRSCLSAPWLSVCHYRTCCYAIAITLLSLQLSRYKTAARWSTSSTLNAVP